MMTRLMWFAVIAVIAVAVVACGGTSATNPAPTTITSGVGQIAGSDLSGIKVEVHQAPG
jgi:hypothetical protein